MVEKITNTKLAILQLYLSDYTLSLHSREMGNRLSKSHVTLLPHLQALEKENVLITRMQGRNKLYRITNNSIAKSYLLLAETLRTITFFEHVFILKTIVDELRVPETLILFGSYAKGTQTSKSDIDLVYFGTLAEDERKRIKRVSQTYNKRIHVQEISRQEFVIALKNHDSLAKEVLENHILVNNPSPFVEAVWEFSH